MIQTKKIAMVFLIVIATVGVIGTAATVVQHALAAVYFNNHYDCDPACQLTHSSKSNVPATSDGAVQNHYHNLLP